MPNFIPYDYRQDTMVVINFEDQILPGTFEHALHLLIEHKLDLSAFHEVYHNDEQGRPAYDPAILLKIILFAYSKGITSSRQIQWCCESNIIFKALSCDTNPDFTTIAAFVSGHSEAIGALFEQVLLVCHEQGLIGHDLIAIDGCKLPSNAAKEWSGTHGELADKRDKLKQQINRKLAEHQAIDSASADADALKRQQRLQRTIDTLNAAHDKVADFLDTAEPRMGNAKRPQEVKSNITDNESAKMLTSKGTIQGYNGIASVDSKHQIIVDAEAIGEGQEHQVLQPALNRIQERYQRLGVSEDIYADGLTVTADTGYANKDNVQHLFDQRIDAYVPDNQFRQRDEAFVDQKSKHGHPHRAPRATAQTFGAEHFVLDPVTRSCTCPAGESMWLKKAGTDQHGNEKLFFMGRLTKCRHCSINAQCMRNPESTQGNHGSGRQVSFVINPCTDKHEASEWMKQRIDSTDGKAIYAQRLATVEPVFGNIRVNKGLDRFGLRGKNKVNAQWQLYCVVHNIEKLANYGSSGSKKQQQPTRIEQ